MPVADSLGKVYENLRKAIAGVGVVVKTADTDDVTAAATVSAGAGAPTAAEPDGSVYLRSDGGASTTIYARHGSAWSAIGSTTLSVGDDTAIVLGADTDFSIEYDENGTDDLRITNGVSDGDIVLEDDMLVFFGTDKDIGLEYDEDGTDDLRVTQGVSTPDLVLPDSMLVIFGTDKDASIGNDGATGLQVLIADNDADAFEIAEGANVYLHCDTRDDQELVMISKIVTGVTTGTAAAPIDMAGAEHTLVLGTAGAAETKLLGNIVYVDANTGSAPENLVLPSAATLAGATLQIINVGGEQLTVNTSVLTLETVEGGFVTSDGTSWTGFGVGAAT